MKKQVQLLILMLMITTSGFSITNIIDIRNGFTQATAIPAGTMVTGVVISDITFGSVDGKNMFIQDATGGIVVRFAAAHSFNVGDSVVVDAGNQTLSEYNGLLEIGGTTPNVPLTNCTVVGTGSVTPRNTTISAVLANMAVTPQTWESTLISLYGVVISGGNGLLTGTNYLISGNDTLQIFTRNACQFNSSTYLTGPVRVTGLLSDFNKAQIVLRRLNDITSVAGIAQINNISAEIKLLSNPAKNTLQIELPSNLTYNDFNNAHLEVYDVRGQMLLMDQVKDQLIRADIAAFEAGMYTYRILLNDKYATGRFIKQ